MSHKHSQKSILLQLFERRVPNILGVYLGMSWVLIEFVGWITQRYELSGLLPDYTLLAMLVLLPSVSLVA